MAAWWRHKRIKNTKKRYRRLSKQTAIIHGKNAWTRTRSCFININKSKGKRCQGRLIERRKEKFQSRTDQEEDCRRWLIIIYEFKFGLTEKWIQGIVLRFCNIMNLKARESVMINFPHYIYSGRPIQCSGVTEKCSGR
jgi:hypothetical protein